MRQVLLPFLLIALAGCASVRPRNTIYLLAGTPCYATAHPHEREQPILVIEPDTVAVPLLDSDNGYFECIVDSQRCWVYYRDATTLYFAEQFAAEQESRRQRIALLDAYIATHPELSDEHRKHLRKHRASAGMDAVVLRLMYGDPDRTTHERLLIDGVPAEVVIYTYRLQHRTVIAWCMADTILQVRDIER